MCSLRWTMMRQISSIRACSPRPCPSAIPRSKTKSHEGAAFCGTFFFGNLGGMRTATTKQESVQASKSRLNGPLTNGHLSWKSGGADSAGSWSYAKSRGGGEVSSSATVFSLLIMGSANEKIPQCGSRDGYRTGGEGSFAGHRRQIVGRTTSHRPGC